MYPLADRKVYQQKTLPAAIRFPLNAVDVTKEEAAQENADVSSSDSKSCDKIL